MNPENHSMELVNSDLQYKYYKCSGCSETTKEFNDKEYTIDLGNGETTTVVGHFDLNMANEILQLVNETRTRWGSREVVLASNDSPLGQAAMIRAYEASYKYSHVRPNGEMGITSFYLTARTEGENLAQGQKSASDVMRDWTNSPSHNENIENFRWGKIGIAVFSRKLIDNSYVNTFCQMFAID